MKTQATTTANNAVINAVEIILKSALVIVSIIAAWAIIEELLFTFGIQA